MVGRASGFSLIELMIVIAIMGILLLAGVPFTAAWVQGAKVSETRSKLLQGYALAKALAQRNPGGIHVPAAAAGLKIDGLDIFVCPGDPATLETCVNDGAGVQWHAALPANTTVAIGGGSGTQTLGLDNTGMPLAAANFSITNGSQNETGELQ